MDSYQTKDQNYAPPSYPNYRFYRPPERPRVRAVAGDRRVVLYWDTRAERSFDPLFGRNPLDANDPGYDFEGYVIYRSTDPSFKDVELVTDGRGAKYLRVPLKVYVREVVRNGRWDLGEDVMFLERGSTNRTTWQVYLRG